MSAIAFVIPDQMPVPLRAANRAATLEPATSGYINAVQVYPFSDGAVYHVLTAPGQVTDIALQPGEALGAVAAGDTVRWVIGEHLPLTTSYALYQGAMSLTHRALVKPARCLSETHL